MIDVQKMGTSLLLDGFEQAAKELGILQVTDAPLEELTNAQRTLDEYKTELLRRCSW